jgi:predicted enzyme related to lactoylglutathione lyase
MLERTTYPAGVPCWVDLAAPDLDAAVAFYSQLFTWQFEEALAPDASGRYCLARLERGRVAGLGALDPVARHSPAWTTYVSVDSANDTAARVIAAGGTLVAAPLAVGAAGRMALIADPAGAVLGVWQPGTTIGAELVNAPRTWNWSNLSTRAVAEARAFYGQVFGWEATPVDFGAGESFMWRVPGYGDFLEQHHPGVQAMHRDAGAPAGFTDAIGWLQPMTGDQSPADPPPHWAVTFSVDDTDRIAHRADHLGGKIVVPPFDVPYARIAVIADPHGAVFTISTYTPPT